MLDLRPIHRIFEPRAVFMIVTAKALIDSGESRVLFRLLHMRERRPMTVLAAHSAKLACAAPFCRNESTGDSKASRVTLLALRIDLKPLVRQRRKPVRVLRADPGVVIILVTLDARRVSGD